MPAKKSTKSSQITPKIIVGVVVLILLLVGGYFFLMKGKSSMVGLKSTVNGIGSIKDALSGSVSMHCEYTDQGKVSKVEIKNGAVRVDYTGQTEQENGSIIVKGKKMYMWNGKQGYVYDVPDDQEKADDKGGSAQGSQKDDLIKSLEQYKDACKVSVVSDSLFTPPTDVTFTDVMKMTNPANSGGSMPSQYQYTLPTSGQDNSAGDSGASGY